jgi:hypothetical protein
MDSTLLENLKIDAKIVVDLLLQDTQEGVKSYFEHLHGSMNTSLKDILLVRLQNRQTKKNI